MLGDRGGAGAVAGRRGRRPLRVLCDIRRRGAGLCSRPREKISKKFQSAAKGGRERGGNGLPRPLAGPRNDVQRAGRGARPNKEPCSPSDALLAAGLDRESGGRYNKNRKRRCRKAAPPDYWFIKIEKPSLGRVAVSAFYGDGDRVFPYVFCQSKHRRGRERTDCRTSVRTGSQ